MAAWYHVIERLYSTTDGRIVREGDPEAARLYAAAGRRIPLAEAERLGLITTDPDPVVIEAPAAITVTFGGDDSSPELDDISEDADEEVAAAEERPAVPDSEDSYPESVGGGWYVLSDGQRIRGRDAAIEAEAALHE